MLGLRDWRLWIRCALVGTGLGAVVLGIGGRISMRGIALLAGAPGSFSIGGSLTVVFLGAVAGLAGALILLILAALLPRRRLLQTMLFFSALVVATLRGINPVDAPRLFLFLPLVLVYGFLLHVLSRQPLPQKAPHA